MNDEIKPSTSELDLDVRSIHNEDNCNKIRIFIVDDQNMVRRSLCSILESEQDLEIVGTAKNASIAIEQIESLQPDLVLMDVEMPQMDGITATKIISERFNKCTVLVLSCHDSGEYINRSLRAGAKGYLLKGTIAQDLIAAIRAVRQGYSQVGPGLLEKIFFSESNTDVVTQSSHELTESFSVPKSSENSQPSLLTKLNASKAGKLTQLFRKEVIKRRLSPERLDQLTQVVNPRAWLPLTAIGLLMLTATGWSIFGRIPVFVEGQGILLRPRRIVQFQSPSSGLLLTLNVESGDRIKKGDVIGTLDQSELRQQLQQEQAKMTELLNQNTSSNILQKRKIIQERENLTLQKTILEKSLDNARSLTPILRDKSLGAISENFKSLQEQKQQLMKLLPAMKERLEVRRRLSQQQAISKDILLQAEQDYLNSLTQISNLEVEQKRLAVEEADQERKYMENLNLINELQTRIQEIAAKQAQLSQQDLERSFDKTNQIKQIKRRIAQLKLQLANRTNIISQYNGRILEVAIIPGTAVNTGIRLGSIEVEDSRASLVSLTYFADKDGKQINSGMHLMITPSVVKRERFGGIVGEVSKVSPFPVTTQDMETIIGNEDLARNLAQNFVQKGGSPIQVFATLQENSNTFSGYEWSSSSGPLLKLSPGTTTSVRVKVDERAPISYIIPLLRSWTGIY